MVGILGTVPVTKITAQARQVHFARFLLALIGGTLIAAGWLTGRFVTAVWLALAWCGVAVKVGWRQARPTRPAPVNR